MYFEDYGQRENALALYAALEKQADVCIGCAAPCIGACPHGVPIRERTIGAHRCFSSPDPGERSKMRPCKIITTGLQFPEGPIALPDGSVLLVEIKRGTLTRVGRRRRADGRRQDAAAARTAPRSAPTARSTCATTAASSGTRSAPFLLPGNQPKDYAGGSIQRVDLATGAVETLYTSCGAHPLRGPNDLVFDRDRRLLVHRPRQDARARPRPRRPLLRASRRLDDPRGGLPARLTERRRPVAGRLARVRGRDAHRPRVLLGPRRAGRDPAARARRTGPPARSGCPACSCSTRSRSTPRATSASRRS